MGRYIFSALILICAVKLFFFTDKAFTMPDGAEASKQSKTEFASLQMRRAAPVE